MVAVVYVFQRLTWESRHLLLLTCADPAAPAVMQSCVLLTLEYHNSGAAIFVIPNPKKIVAITLNCRLYPTARPDRLYTLPDSTTRTFRQTPATVLKTLVVVKHPLLVVEHVVLARIPYCWPAKMLLSVPMCQRTTLPT